MSLESEVAALVGAADALTAVVKDKISQIDQRVGDAEQEFEGWLQQKDIVGEIGANGTQRVGIFQGLLFGVGAPFGVGGDGGFEGKVSDLGSSDNVYVHFKVPLNVNTSDRMYRFDIKGYCYGSSSIIDETIVGYVYADTKSIVNKASFGDMFPDSYADSAGNLILRIKLPVAYFVTVRVDNMCVESGGVLFERGSLDVKMSLAETVEF